MHRKGSDHLVAEKEHTWPLTPNRVWAASAPAASTARRLWCRQQLQRVGSRLKARSLSLRGEHRQAGCLGGQQPTQESDAGPTHCMPTQDGIDPHVRKEESLALHPGPTKACSVELPHQAIGCVEMDVVRSALD